METGGGWERVLQTGFLKMDSSYVAARWQSHAHQQAKSLDHLGLKNLFEIQTYHMPVEFIA